MCSPKKLAQMATIGAATAGLVGCINSNFNVGGNNNTQIVGDNNQTEGDGAHRTRARQTGCEDHADYVSHTQQREVCREYHDHTEQCVRSTTQAPSGDCDPRWFVAQAVSADYLDKSRFFACNAFEDRNHNGPDNSDIVGGPRTTFRTSEPFSLVGWEISGKDLRATFTMDSNGTVLYSKEWPGRRGGYEITIPASTLPHGTYTVRWERDECGQGQWNERGRQTITVIDCTPRVQQQSTQRYDCHPSSNPGIVESIK